MGRSNLQHEEDEGGEVLPPTTPTTPTRPAHPFVEASCLSKLLFIWPYHLMSGKHRVHNNDDETTRAAIEECDLPGEKQHTRCEHTENV